MPTLHLAVSTCGTAPDAAQLAATLTRLTTTHLHKRADLTAVRIEFVPPGQWTIGAQSLLALQQASYRLAIDVSAGTNSAAEASAFIAAVHRAMVEALGAVHPASYVLVQAQPATHWGWGGCSQAQRQLPGSPVRA